MRGLGKPDVDFRSNGSPVQSTLEWRQAVKAIKAVKTITINVDPKRKSRIRLPRPSRES